MMKIRKIMPIVLFAICFFPLPFYMPGLIKNAAAASTGAPADEGGSDGIPYWDFGEVKEGDIVTHIFALQNQTNQPISVTQINSSSACTTVKAGGDLIPPRGILTVEIRFDTKGYSGEKRRFIYVHTDSDRTPLIMFAIKARVVKTAN